MSRDETPPAYDGTREFLTDHEDGETVIRRLLEVDAESDTWEFDDVPVDSGVFGEIVSRDIVENADGAYRIRDREAVQAAIEGEEPSFEESPESDEGFGFDVDVDWTVTGGVVGALAVVFVARILQYGAVFQNGWVVSPGNDPYFFRYWQEQLLEQSGGLLDFGVLVDPIWDSGTWNERPLTHATNWWVSELLGGGQGAAEFVAAWLPVVLGLLGAILVYYLAVAVTDDVRVGIVAILVVALAPIHVNYTGLGLLHHRPHHMVWFVGILLTLTWLVRDLQRRVATSGVEQAVDEYLGRRRTWATALAFGGCVGLYTHSWGGAGAVFVPIAGYLSVRTYLDYRRGLNPGRSLLPIVAGLGVGAAIAAGLHLLLGWHGILSPGVAVLTFLGGGLLVGIGHLWDRFDLSPTGLALVQPAIGLVGLGLLVVVQPETVDLFMDSFGSILTRRSPATQAESLYTNAIVFGPIGQIGVVFYVGIAVLGWILWRTAKKFEPMLLALGIFGLFYLLTAGFMVRFAFRLVPVIAVFGAFGTVYLLSVVDLVQRPTFVRGDAERSRSSDTDSSGYTADFGNLRWVGGVLAIGLLVFGFNLIFVPTTGAQLTHDSGDVETAAFIANHSDQLDRERPQNRVFSPWGSYRMYNYFVNGDAEQELFARDNYASFASEGDPDDWYEDFRFRYGYVILSDDHADITSSTESDRLSAHLGHENERFDGLEHYRAVRLDDEDDIAVFMFAEGARVEVEAASGDSVTLSTDVSTSGHSFTYSRTVSVHGNGTATATVPYPGDYDIDGQQVTVSLDAVRNGDTVTVTSETDAA